GELRRDLALEGKERLVGVGAGERMEGRRHAGEAAAAALERRDRVLEARRRLIGRDGRDLAAMLGERRPEGRGEMLRLDRRERRRREGRRPFGEERIVAVGRGG